MRPPYVVTVTGTEVENGYRAIQVNALGGNDARTPQEMLPPGLDCVPVKDAKAYYMTTASFTSADIVLGYVNKSPKAQPGESRLYSTDTDGGFKYNVWLRAAGEVLIGDSDDPSDYDKHLTQYEALRSAFDDLKGKLNDLINKYNTHTHTGVQTGSGTSAVTAATETPATSDMSSAKIDHTKTKA